MSSALVALGAACGPTPPPPPTIFPSDSLTVADTNQRTGRRMNLPLPDCRTDNSECDEVRLINQLDGFDLDPTVALGFTGRVDVAKVTPSTVWIETLDGGWKTPLVRLVQDGARLYGHPRDQLSDATSYRVQVTSGVNGQAGSATFTTQSATTGLQRMQAQLDNGAAYTAAGIAPADRGLDFVRPGGVRTSYPRANVLRIRRFNDVGPDLVEEQVFDSSQGIPDAAGTIAFGSIRSPSWLTTDRVIPTPPSKSGPTATGQEEVGFALVVPQATATRPKPAGGWPVAIYGPGVTRSKYDVFLASDENLRRGIATIAIDPVGHSFGPNSQAGVDLAIPPSMPRFSGFGRAEDIDQNGMFDASEGVSTLGQPSRFASVGFRDGLRQTAADNMALVRAIENGNGNDVDGDGTRDLRTSGITYFAQSLGGIYGTMTVAIDPKLSVGALNVPGGPITEIARLSPGFRPDVAIELGRRVPELLNGGNEGFSESLPLFLDPAVTAPASGAIPIQQALARGNWISRGGSPEAFSPLLRRRPLGGTKRVLYQFAFGDATVPNPTSATLVRAGDLLDRTTYYRNDRTPTATMNPHGFLIDPRISGRQPGQLQIAEFLATNGQSTIDPDGAAVVFETPISDRAALERTNF